MFLLPYGDIWRCSAAATFGDHKPKTLYPRMYAQFLASSTDMHGCCCELLYPWNQLSLLHTSQPSNRLSVAVFKSALSLHSFHQTCERPRYLRPSLAYLAYVLMDLHLVPRPCRCSKSTRLGNPSCAILPWTHIFHQRNSLWAPKCSISHELNTKSGMLIWLWCLRAKTLLEQECTFHTCIVLQI